MWLLSAVANRKRIPKRRTAAPVMEIDVSKERLIGQLLLTAAPLGNDFLKELVWQAHLFGGKDGPAWKAVLQRTRKAGLPNMPKVKNSLFIVIATTDLDAIAEKPTAACFEVYLHRDSDFDEWLPQCQPATDVCTITTLGMKKSWRFAEAARALPGVEETLDIVTLGRSLIENGYTMTLAQAEDMVKRTMRWETTGMHSDGVGNFFFVETGVESIPVLVGGVRLGASGWLAHSHRFESGLWWNAEYRLLVRNLDASKL